MAGEVICVREKEVDGNCVTSTPFCYKSKSALKKKSIKKRERERKR